jgi:hypothetical protein
MDTLIVSEVKAVALIRKDFCMPKTPTNHGKPWTPAAVKHLQTLAKQNTPARVIGLKLGRTESAVYSAASEVGVSLKPTNQSPYNRRTK